MGLVSQRGRSNEGTCKGERPGFIILSCPLLWPHSQTADCRRQLVQEAKVTQRSRPQLVGTKDPVHTSARPQGNLQREEPLSQENLETSRIMEIPAIKTSVLGWDCGVPPEHGGLSLSGFTRTPSPLHSDLPPEHNPEPPRRPSGH